MLKAKPSIGIAYICRGKDESWQSTCRRFRDSFLRQPAGVENQLYVLFKGFDSLSSLEEATQILEGVPYKAVHLEDNAFDIGAYTQWANQIDEDLICALNSSSEPLCSQWLQKLWVNLNLPNVGIVGASGSYESLSGLDPCFPEFPNIHLRSTGFLIRRDLFCRLTKDYPLETKLDAYKCESGPDSLTQRILKEKLQVLVVGRNGRGYPPLYWRESDTFRQGTQTNLLIADGQTRVFDKYVWADRYTIMHNTFGDPSMKLVKNLGL
jgi:hypothetical protein